MKTFKQHLEEMKVRDPAGNLINIPKIKYRGADMKIHTAYPGKSSSSGGGDSGGSGNGGS